MHLTENGRQYCEVWQKDRRRGWVCMCRYWMTGIIVGVYSGYWQHLFKWTHFVGCESYSIHALAFVTTLACQPSLLMRFGSYGRKPSFLPSVVFALTNGTCETFLFLASYDAGKYFASKIYHFQSYVVECMCGFLWYNLYAAIIHAWFWLPHAFPQHTLPNAPEFHTTMLPALVLMSSAWLVLYERTADVKAIVFLHALTNILFAIRIGLPLPI